MPPIARPELEASAAVTLGSSTMRALQLTGKWQPRSGYRPSSEEESNGKAATASKVWRYPQLEFTRREIPAITDDEVLVRVKACGVCGSDVHCAGADDEGYVLFSGIAKLPVTIGHEFSGEVVEVGRQVTTLKPGDAVAAESIMWCGICASCRSGHFNQCQRVDLLGFSLHGAFAEYIAIKEKFCWSLEPLRASSNEDELYESGALIEPIGCAYNGMFIDTGGFRPGAYVAVFGAGPIGLAAVMLARAAGAAKVFAFDLSEPRNRLAVAAGADYSASPTVLRAQGTSPAEVLNELTHGMGIDMLVEAAGAASETIPEMERSFAQNGRMVFLGRRDTVSALDFNPLVSRANHIVGARGHAGGGTFPSVIRLLASRRIPALGMVTSRYRFDEAKEAIARSAAREDGKVIVRFP